MAARLAHEVRAPARPARAEQELHELLEVLSERGILRALRDFVGGLPGISLIVARALNQPETIGAVQNLALILKALGTLPPAELSRLLDSAQAAAASVHRAAGRPPEQDAAPGVTGAYKLLQDDDLWRTLHPLLEGLRMFGTTLVSVKDGPPVPKPDEPLI